MAGYVANIRITTNGTTFQFLSQPVAGYVANTRICCKSGRASFYPSQWLGMWPTYDKRGGVMTSVSIPASGWVCGQPVARSSECPIQVSIPASGWVCGQPAAINWQRHSVKQALGFYPSQWLGMWPTKTTNGKTAQWEFLSQPVAGYVANLWRYHQLRRLISFYPSQWLGMWPTAGGGCEERRVSIPASGWVCGQPIRRMRDEAFRFLSQPVAGYVANNRCGPYGTDQRFYPSQWLGMWPTYPLAGYCQAS